MGDQVGRRIKETRELLGLTQTEIARELGVSKELISMVESGKKRPSMRVLSGLARVLGRDVSYLVGEREEPFIAVFRAGELSRPAKRQLGRVIGLVEDYRWLEDLMGAIPGEAPRYPQPSNSDLEGDSLYAYADKLAEQERARLGLGSEPVRNVFELLESQGLHVIHLDLGDDSVAGVLLHSDEKGAFAVINTRMTRGRQVFTAAHEYCHYLKDRDETYRVDRYVSERADERSKSSVERIANAFAASFLMPRIAVLRMAADFGTIGPEEVLYLKRYFGVSYQAMAYRLRGLGRVAPRELDPLLAVHPMSLEHLLFETSSEDERPKQRLPERYVRLALGAYANELISLAKLAELLDIDIVSLRTELAGAGLLPTTAVA